MKKFCILLILILLLSTSVSALDFTAPDAPPEVEKYIKNSSNSFWSDLLFIIKRAITVIYPNITNAARCCVRILSVVILVSIFVGFSEKSQNTVDLAGTIAVGTILLQPSGTLIHLGLQTVESLSEYGKLLFPVMASALAAEGATLTSSALYTGTVIFNTILTSSATNLLIPLLYAFLAIGFAKAAFNEQILANIHSFLKWLMTWILKLSLYLFTGYLGITGVVSGTADASAVKAAKIAISSTVPVIGSIISDASEAILVSAGVMKNSVGIYGLIVLLAIWIEPFLQISVQYLFLKITGAVCGILGSKRIVALVNTFTLGMGFLVALTGTVCLLLLISTVCFMRGVG